ncbi:MAG TPA: UBP-type zinc finger domain-containing protein [Myxococcales bacterium]|nr:UBP-type zinc finger domain-containing protein [Myxococcales bacterium]
MADICAHLEKLEDPDREPVKPSGNGCKECLAAGDIWVHLRLCMICGHVGCCDSSPNKHATKHFHRTQHPTIKSFEPDEDWAYCYPDELTIDGVTSLPGEKPPRHYEAPAAGL